MPLPRRALQAKGQGADEHRPLGHTSDSVSMGSLVVLKQPASDPVPGPGEIDALQLPMETRPSLLIVDDRLATRPALRLGLDYIGTVRMLLLAERRSLIDDAETVVQRMTANSSRISPRVLQQLKARETPGAHKLGPVEAASEFLERRAAGARPDELTRYLDDAPDTPPAPGDELPEA